MSAHWMSEVFNFRTFKSTKRRSHDRGSKDETVIKPSGGKAHLFPSNGKAWRKLQYVSGNSGFTNRTFIMSSYIVGACRPIAATSVLSGFAIAKIQNQNY